ncbi:MAG: substrate-binding domain-containing protein [Spirochaetales bacterium]|nr:substrate-binding domain-containing protein [Spirochaetales bacterium]
MKNNNDHNFHNKKQQSEFNEAKSGPRFGFFSCWFRGDYHVELISGIEHEAKRKGAQLFYFAGRTILSEHHYENNYNVVYDTALDASLDGLVIMSMLNNYNIDKEMNEFLERFASIPLVTINFKATHGNAILTNNDQGFHQLLLHLIKDHGYRKIGFINGPDTNFDAMKRFTIYRSVLQSYGITLDPSLITTSYFDYFSGKKAISTFLDERKLKPGRDMEVIVCATDESAWGAMDGLEERGVRIPGDIALTGFNDIRYIIFPKKPITTVRQQIFDMGRAAINSLLDYDPKRHDQIFDTELIIRTSCGCTMDDSIQAAGPESKSFFIDGSALENISGFAGDRKDLEFFFFEIIAVMNNLKLLKNISDLDEWMVQNLPTLGIKSAYLFMYSPSSLPSRSVRLIAGFDQKKQKYGDSKKIISLSTVFNDILSLCEPGQSDSGNRQSYCILPLLYKDEHYGLLALEVNVYSSIAYDALSSQIGNSIKSMLLMEEVKRMNQKLLHVNEQKTRFFINIAHETKTPLTLIQNYLERSMKRHAGDPDLTIVKQNIDTLLEHMLKFLDAEGLEKGTITYSHDSYIDLSESVQKKCALFRPVADKKNITLIVQVEEQSVIKIDPWALDRILNNLLDNAVKYTPVGGKVLVEVQHSAGESVLRVSDNGPGLSGDILSHMFEPYYQLSRNPSSKQGIGVGLSIVKKIIDDLGASITVENSSNGGACFTCKFNLVKEPDHSQTLDNFTFPESIDDQFTPGQPSEGLVFPEDITEEDISGDKVSILIVDDNIQMLNFLKVSLKKSYNVFLSTDVPSALAKLKTIDRPELIISDIMMDGPDGYALLDALANTGEYCDIPFIFLTAVSNKDEEIRGLSGGAIDYIKKPFSLTELEKKIESIIALRQNMKKREIMNLRQGIDNLFSEIEGKKNRNPCLSFEKLCIKYGFSSREKEITKFLLDGLLNKEIAFRLHLSKRAIEYHITNIFKKVGVSKRNELISTFRS